MRRARLLTPEQIQQHAQELVNLRIDMQNAFLIAPEAERIYRLAKQEQKSRNSLPNQRQAHLWHLSPLTFTQTLP